MVARFGVLQKPIRFKLDCINCVGSLLVPTLPQIVLTENALKPRNLSQGLTTRLQRTNIEAWTLLWKQRDFVSGL